MTLVTYSLAPGITGGSVSYGSGQGFNFGAAAAAGGGSFTVDDTLNLSLVIALDRSPGVVRSGSPPGTPIIVDQIGPILAHQVGPNMVPGALPQLGADGIWTPVLPTTALTALTLQNGWVNIGAGFANAGYRKDGQGFVHLEGLIGSGTQTAGTLLATLPVLYRPDAFKLYTCPVNNTGGTATIQVGTDGTIKWQGSTGTVSWVDLGACVPFLAGN